MFFAYPEYASFFSYDPCFDDANFYKIDVLLQKQNFISRERKRERKNNDLPTTSIFYRAVSNNLKQ